MRKQIVELAPCRLAQRLPRPPVQGANVGLWCIDGRAELGGQCLGSPGLTIAQIRERLVPQLSQKHFPGGAKAGWLVG